VKFPSEVLNRKFELADAPVEALVEQVQSAGKFLAITTHAVMVGNIGLLLPQNEVSELAENLSVCRLPNTPTWFNGVTSVRGNMIPVFDVHELFGVKGRGKDRNMIVVGIGETAAAFWIDEMPAMVMVTSDDMMSNIPPLPQIIKDFSRNYYLKDDQTWIDWDVNQFFNNVGSRLLM
jgi:chemotaxis signal transduction protein